MSADSGDDNGDDDGVTIRRSRRAGYRGLVADVLVDGASAGLVHLTGTTPPTELVELWSAPAAGSTGRAEFLTEQEAIAHTVGLARRRGGGMVAP